MIFGKRKRMFFISEEVGCCCLMLINPGSGIAFLIIPGGVLAGKNATVALRLTHTLKFVSLQTFLNFEKQHYVKHCSTCWPAQCG